MVMPTTHDGSNRRSIRLGPTILGSVKVTMMDK